MIARVSKVLSEVWWWVSHRSEFYSHRFKKWLYPYLRNVGAHLITWHDLSKAICVDCTRGLEANSEMLSLSIFTQRPFPAYVDKPFFEYLHLMEWFWWGVHDVLCPVLYLLIQLGAWCNFESTDRRAEENRQSNAAVLFGFSLN